MTIPINLSISDIYRPKIEELSEMAESLFRETYIEASINALKIINDREAILKEARNKDKICSKNSNFFIETQCHNNIIAFTGDRGTGKTSGMISFVNALTQLSTASDEDIEFSSELQYIKDKKYRFSCLKVIEPSNFVKGERLLEIVISNMYSNVSYIIKSSGKDIDTDAKQKIYREFGEVYSSLQTMYSDKKDLLETELQIGSALETLDQLSRGQKLKCSFDKLVKAYLHFTNTFDNNCDGLYRNDICTEKRNILIIPIDDLDMNMDNSFEMAEEIRRYLVTKNVIVTMAINIAQFTQLAEQEYIKVLEKLYDKGLLKEAPADMAAKYLTKLIPTNRRNSLPFFDSNNISNVKIKNEIYLVDYFLDKIYKTTGLILLKNESKSHEIIPTNLREIHYLNQLLKDMEEAESSSEVENIVYRSRTCLETKGKLNRNLERFENYLENYYIKSKMPLLYTDILLELMKQDSEIMNKYLVRALVKRSDDNTTDEKVIKISSNDSVSDSILYEITDPRALPQNISIGDILFLLQQITIQKSDYQTKKFVEGVKIIYSIRLIRHMFVENIDEERGNYVKKERRILGEFLYNTERLGLLSANREMLAVSSIKESDFFKDNINNFVFNSLISRYTKLDRNSKGAIKRIAYNANNYEAAYEFPYNPGTTDNLVINFTSFIVNLLDIKVLEDRINQYSNSIKLEKPDRYAEWENKYIAVLPVWSLDFIDIFFKKIKRKAMLKENSEDEYNIFIIKLLKGIQDVIIDIVNDNAYLYNSNAEETEEQYCRLVRAFTKNPILSLENFDDSTEIINQIGIWYKESEEKNKENKKEKSKEKNKYTGTKPKKLTIFNDEYSVKYWSEVLQTLIGVLFDQKPDNYKLIKGDMRLQRLKISNEKFTKGKKIISEKYNEYINTTFDADTIYNLCKLAMDATYNNENDFKVTLSK